MRKLFAASAQYFLKFAIFTLTAGILAASISNAQANSKYAGIIIDAKTGKVLYEENADAPRFPASLTKMMTLYLVFEALSTGQIKKNSAVVFSANAAKEPPTKLGVKAGGRITVEQAILALVTRSANDVATALAEMLGKTETNFARMMTIKARQLGMHSSTFRNAHGLPNSEQKTTARDMARLSIALREHFPQYYSYFSTRTFTFSGQKIGNHNKLLGQIKGVDGIKTGYTRASGFNLASSLSADNRQIVGVVMGGTSGARRDAQMASLIKRYLPKASTGRNKDLIARGAPLKSTISPQAPVVASAGQLPRIAPIPPQRPEMVMTAYAQEPSISARNSAVEAIIRSSVDTFETASTGEITPPASVSNWIIQVASATSEEDALRFLEKTVKTAGSILAEAVPFTEQFNLKGNTYYRARFRGFETKSAAWDACASLKKKQVECYAVQN